MEAEIDLPQTARDFYRVLDDLRYFTFKREREFSPNAPLSRFFPICRDEQQAQEFEKRYREGK